MNLNNYYNKETKTLTLPQEYNEVITNVSKEIEIIIFKKYSIFNKPVDNLPEKLTHLTFGFNFNQSVDNLPENLTYLSFIGYFNKLVDNLPKNLTHLTFGRQTPVRLAHPKIMNIFIIV
jgi:hypothetical protein